LLSSTSLQLCLAALAVVMLLKTIRPAPLREGKGQIRSRGPEPISMPATQCHAQQAM
jgi:hypothetical protein